MANFLNEEETSYQQEYYLYSTKSHTENARVLVYFHFRVQQHTKLSTLTSHWERNPPWVNLSAGFHIRADFEVVEGVRG